MPYYQMPVLEEDSKILAQSEAIAMYLAKKYGKLNYVQVVTCTSDIPCLLCSFFIYRKKQLQLRY